MDLRDVKEFLKDSLWYIVAALIVFFLVVYIVSFQFVSGSSMEPTYNSQDILLLNKMHYRIFKPKRFDVIAVLDKEGVPNIKRLIGLPGETVEYREGKLYINGNLESESFAKGSESGDFKSEAIPKGYYFFVGDNREKSTDSRDERIGLISEDDLIGKVWFRVWRVKK